MSEEVVICPMCSKHCITGTLAYKKCELRTATPLTTEPTKPPEIKNDTKTL